MSVVKTPAFADRHPMTSRALAAAIVLALVGSCLGALVTSWGEPHARVMTLVGVTAAVALYAAWWLNWNRRHRVSPELTFVTGIVSVLAMSFVCVGDGWLRAFGAALLLPLLLIPAFAILAALRR
jgi:uncharacterized membrane protein YfcA